MKLIFATLLVFALALPGTASAYGANLNCVETVPPSIKVDPVSDEIKYDFSVPSRDLSPVRLGAAAASAYPAGTDTVTGGLRWDTPVTGFEIETGDADFSKMHQACLWYKTVSVKIRLSPHIYIAKEFSAPGSCREAIMAHELHHVDVDREMMNKYSQLIGEAVQKVADETGAVGPIDSDKIDEKRDELLQKVKTAIGAAEEPLHAEMSERQAQVDSPEEYRRVSAICNAQLSASANAPAPVSTAVQPAAQAAMLSGNLSDDDLQGLKDKVAQGNAEALQTISNAATQGSAHAQNDLGDMYYKGIAVRQDTREAIRWYTKAAMQGYGPAQASIVTILQQNHGITQAAQ